MQIEYSTNRLRDASLSLSEANRVFGVSIGRKYIQRLMIIRAVDKFEDLFGFRALRLRPLRGDRQGQRSIMLSGNYRLIIEKISEDKLRVVGVEDYHGD